MVESYVFTVAEKVLAKLGPLAYQEICLAWGVKRELNKLEETLSTIKAVLLDAEEQQAKNHALSVWLGKLKDVCYDVDDVLDEFEYEALRCRGVNRGGIKIKVRNFFSRSNPLVFRFKMGHKIKEIGEKLDVIAAERTKFHLNERGEDRRVLHIERETHSFVQASDVIGRDVDKEKIIQLLMRPSDHDVVSVIPIVGIGGLGKTTLAKLIYNDERVGGHFQFKMWVCVSDDFDTQRLTKEIINSATGTNCGDLTMDQLQTRLRDIIKDKNYLLILDDVWNEDREKWTELKNLLMLGANESKIIVTTRNESVALTMGTVHINKLEGLSHDDSMSLFVKWAFKNGEEKQYPNLLKIGEEIVKKCRGVPLAVRTLGSLLYSKVDVRDWKFVANNEIWQLEQKENDILPALKLSYNAMPSYLKQCFAFLSIFPKDYPYDDIELIQLWMAQGFIQPSRENEELEDIGQRYFKELLSRSFFVDVEDNYFFLTFKIHDLVHDLALSVAQTECLGINLRTHKVSKGVRHVSFSGKDVSVDEVPRFLLEQNNLRTIFFPIDGMGPTSQSFAETCISRFKYLRVLDLGDSSFEVLPSSIGNLKHLRYLDLPGNRVIKRLPDSICKLHNLQTLRLFGCVELEELPKDIGNLINLRCLLLTTKQILLPEEGVGRLISLRFLGLAGRGNLKSLCEGIRRLTALRTLLIEDCESLESLPSSMKYLTALEALAISNCKKLNLMEWDGPVQGLRSLSIGGLQQLVGLPHWLQGAANSLQHLRIGDCRNLTTLPEWLQNLTSLQKLWLEECPKLSALPEGMHRLTALRELNIKYCRILRSRCLPDKGVDWPKIAHVPEITLNAKKIKSIDN